MAGHLLGVKALCDLIGTKFVDTPEESLFGVIRGLCEQDRGGLSSNYEDWLFVAIQVRDHLLRDYENPGLIPLIGYLNSQLGSHAASLKELTHELILRIERIVCDELQSKKGRAADAYPKLAEAITARPQIAYRFFSLNHDVLLEQYFRAAQLEYYDGFVPIAPDKAGRRFEFAVSEFRRSKISLVKLHGSVDWWRLRYMRARDERNPWLHEFVGVGLGDDRQFDTMGQTPLILAGTFNKILQYSSPVFLTLLAEFFHTLEMSSTLLVCGYGFGDKGINTLIANWMSEDVRRRLVVVDPQPFHEHRTRGAIISKVGRWKAENRLIVFENRISEEFTWENILSGLEPLCGS